MSKLLRSSIITLSLLFSFVFFICVLVGLYFDSFSLPVAIAITIIINVVTWACGPFVSDIIYRWVYKITFYDEKEFSTQFPQHHVFLSALCKKYDVKFPKIGYIDDGNPTAFSYGSHKGNARIVFTKGITNFLTLGEVQAVLAHEMGHIVHNDFIVMTIANTLVQILYEIYFVCTRTRSKGNSKGKGAGVLIGILSYVFYIVGSYIVLYLSRTREYYADEFSANETGNPDLLSDGLIKIAYGILEVPDSENSKRLLNSTRSLGLIDVKQAGYVTGFLSARGDKNILAEIMSFDLVSPWAKIIELSSTHPLTGKRIKALSAISKTKGLPPTMDFDAAIARLAIDHKRLYDHFYTDLIFYLMTPILIFPGIIIGGISSGVLGIGAGILGAMGLGGLIKSFYQYPKEKVETTTVLTLMRSPYASPVRGQYVKITGQVVGKGTPGYIFSEDMMLQDSTGLIYINMVTLFGFFTDIFFAIGKVKELLKSNQPVVMEGWFIRGMTHSLTLSQIQEGEKVTHSYPYVWERIIGVGLLILSIFAFLIFMSGTITL